MYLSIVKEERVLQNLRECCVYVDEEGLAVLEAFAEYCRTKNEAEHSKKELITLINSNGDTE